MSAVEDRVAGGRYRHADAEVTADRFVLADEHVHDDAVDAVVGAVQGDRADDLPRLAEPVHPAFALLMAGRVPRQVVVDDRLEILLQVDALGQAVGGDQDLSRFPGGIGEAAHPFGALLRCQLAGHHLNRGLRELLPEVGGDVVGGRYEPAEHDRVEAVGQQRPDCGGQFARAWCPGRR